VGDDRVPRPYGQLCGLALGLDAIGDRWSLLIVRELLVRPDGARYTDLRQGLPGIATNLLADRLRHLAAADVVRREDPRPPVATPVFRLTERGAALRPAVEALAVWGGGFVPEAAGDAEFRTRWLVIPIEAMLADSRPDEPPVTLALRTGDEPLTVEVGGGQVHARTGEPEHAPDLAIAGPPKPVLGVLAGRLPREAAAGVGVRITGDLSVLERVGLLDD
jgi:DNA-binding HxlR family transcriptional regulator